MEELQKYDSVKGENIPIYQQNAVPIINGPRSSVPLPASVRETYFDRWCLFLDHTTFCFSLICSFCLHYIYLWQAFSEALCVCVVYWEWVCVCCVAWWEWVYAVLPVAPDSLKPDEPFFFLLKHHSHPVTLQLACTLSVNVRTSRSHLMDIHEHDVRLHVHLTRLVCCLVNLIGRIGSTSTFLLF